MAAWDLTSAIASLRARLSDGATDKYIHLSPVDPEPNGVTREFAVPDSRLVTGTVKVFLDDEQITVPEYDPLADPAQPEYIDLAAGRIVIAAPDTGQVLRASYYFQWFTDAELAEFLALGATLSGFTGIDDAAMALTFRAPITSLAAHYAYLKMAANSAQALQAGAGGYTADNTAEHPNWRYLAELMWKTYKDELDAISNNPATVNKPAMKFVSFGMSRYVPRS